MSASTSRGPPKGGKHGAASAQNPTVKDLKDEALSATVANKVARWQAGRRRMGAGQGRRTGLRAGVAAWPPWRIVRRKVPPDKDFRIRDSVAKWPTKWPLWPPAPARPNRLPTPPPMISLPVRRHPSQWQGSVASGWCAAPRRNRGKSGKRGLPATRFTRFPCSHGLPRSAFPAGKLLSISLWASGRFPSLGAGARRREARAAAGAFSRTFSGVAFSGAADKEVGAWPVAGAFATS